MTPEERVRRTFSKTLRRMSRKSQSTSRSRSENASFTNQW